MKRIICLMLAVIIMTAIAGAAAGEGWFPTWENTPTPAPTMMPASSDSGFTFRNGIRWSMTPEDVRAAMGETVQMEERSQENWSVLYSVGRVEVSRLCADRVFIFRDRQLNMILYAFDRSEPQSSYTYLTGALGSVYGENQTAEASEVVALMDMVYPGMYTADGISGVNSWMAADGTRIYLYRQNGASFSVLYASPAAGLPAGGTYITNGL